MLGRLSELPGVEQIFSLAVSLNMTDSLSIDHIVLTQNRKRKVRFSDKQIELAFNSNLKDRRYLTDR